MKIKFTIQMFLDNINTYHLTHLKEYEQILDNELSSKCILLSIDDLENPSGPDFHILLEGRLSQILKDVMILTGSEVDKHLKENIDSFEQLDYDDNQIRNMLTPYQKLQLRDYFHDIGDVDLINE